MGQFVLDKVLDMMDECGDTNQMIILKTDQEPSIVALVEDIVKEKAGGQDGGRGKSGR